MCDKKFKNVEKDLELFYKRMEPSCMAILDQGHFTNKKFTFTKQSIYVIFPIAYNIQIK
jgi:hypothetical protein